MVRYLLVTFWNWSTFFQCAEDLVVVQLANFLFDCVTSQCILVFLIHKELLLGVKRYLHTKLNLNGFRLSFGLECPCQVTECLPV